MARISRNKGQVSECCELSDVLYSTAVYVRLSIEDNQNGSKDSIDNQRYMLKKFIEQQLDMKFYDYYVDNGWTGTNFARPAFNRLMEDIKKGIVNCIVVKDLSRFGRDYIETGNYLEKIFPFMGVRFISMNDNYDSNNADSDSEALILSLKNLVNDMYAKDISKKVGVVFKMKQKKGEFLGGHPPYGYLHSDEGTHKLKIDPEASLVVKQIFDWYLEGLGQSCISRKLNQQGVLPPRRYYLEKGIIKSKRYENSIYWQTSAIKRILKNPVYLGHMLQGKSLCSLVDGVPRHLTASDEWIGVLNAHEPIIEAEIYQKAMKIMQSKTEEYKKNCDKNKVINRKENILVEKLFCGDCKKPMIRRCDIESGKRKYCFCCKTYEKHDRTACTSKRITEENLYNAIVQVIQTQITLAAELRQKIKNPSNIQKKKLIKNELEQKISVVKAQITKNTSFKNELYKDYADGILSGDEYMMCKEKYSSEISKLNEALENLFSQMKVQEEVLSVKNKWLTSNFYFKGEKCLTKEMVDSLIQKIDVYDENRIEITFNYKDVLLLLLKEI